MGRELEPDLLIIPSVVVGLLTFHSVVGGNGPEDLSDPLVHRPVQVVIIRNTIPAGEMGVPFDPDDLMVGQAGAVLPEIGRLLDERVEPIRKSSVAPPTEANSLGVPGGAFAAVRARLAVIKNRHYLFLPTNPYNTIFRRRVSQPS